MFKEFVVSPDVSQHQYSHYCTVKTYDLCSACFAITRSGIVCKRTARRKNGAVIISWCTGVTVQCRILSLSVSSVQITIAKCDIAWFRLQKVISFILLSGVESDIATAHGKGNMTSTTHQLLSKDRRELESSWFARNRLRLPQSNQKQNSGNVVIWHNRSSDI